MFDTKYDVVLKGLICFKIGNSGGYIPRMVLNLCAEYTLGYSRVPEEFRASFSEIC
jgi:hypothetical protein